MHEKGKDSKEGDQFRYLKGLMNSEVEYRLLSAEKGARYKEYKWRVSHCKMLCSGLSLTKSKGFRNVAWVRLQQSEEDEKRRAGVRMIYWHGKAWVLFVPHFFVLFSSQEPTPSRPTKKAKASPQSPVIIRGSRSTRSTRVSIYLVYLLHETLGKICQNEQELHPHEEIRHRSSIGTGSLVLCLCYRHQSRGQGSHSVCHMWLICNMRRETTSCAFGWESSYLLLRLKAISNNAKAGSHGLGDKDMFSGVLRMRCR